MFHNFLFLPFPASQQLISAIPNPLQISDAVAPRSCFDLRKAMLSRCFPALSAILVPFSPHRRPGRSEVSGGPLLRFDDTPTS